MHRVRAPLTTYEEIERADIRVIKRDGAGEPFDRTRFWPG